MSVWKMQGERLAKNKYASHQKYDNARDETNSYINVTLETQINDLVASGWFGKIDLSEEQIPSSVTNAVNVYLSSAAVQPEMRVKLFKSLETSSLVRGNLLSADLHDNKGTKDTSLNFFSQLVTATIVAVLDWAARTAREMRAASGDSLKAELRERCEWQEWSAVHK